MRVGATILTYRDSYLTTKCAIALRDQAPVTIVCNGSDGRAEDALRVSAPWAPLVSHEQNLPFSEVFNLAAERSREAGEDALLFVTNDVAVSPGVVEGLVGLVSEQGVAAAAPIHLRADNHGMVHHAGGEYRFDRAKAIIAGGGEPWDDWKEPRVYDRAWLDGGVALYRTDALADVGPWRPEYGFYWEDVDWGLRARAKGWSLRVDTSLVAYHQMSATSSSVRWWQRYMLARNRCVCARFNLPEADYRKVMTYLKRSARIRLLRRPFDVDAHLFFHGVFDYDRGVQEGPLAPIPNDAPFWRERLGPLARTDRRAVDA